VQDLRHINYTDWNTVKELQINSDLIYTSIHKTINKIGNQIGISVREIKKEDIISNDIINETEDQIIQATGHFKKLSKDKAEELLDQINSIIGEKEVLTHLFLRLRIVLHENN